MTSFRILGPIEVGAGDRRVVLSGPRQVSLLAFLLVNANRAVTMSYEDAIHLALEGARPSRHRL
ncbi:MAG: hypothetical protein ACXVRM_04315 [Solirubrobacteraceae bacterium]